MNLPARPTALLLALSLIFPAPAMAQKEPLRLAQKAEDPEEGGKRERRGGDGKRPDRGERPPKGERGERPERKQGDPAADSAKQDAIKQKRLEAQEAKERAVREKQDAVKARQDGDKQKQRDAQQAKERAAREKQDAVKARQEGDKQRQFDAQAKERAVRERQDADRARQDAIKQKQDAAEQARQDALKKKEVEQRKAPPAPPAAQAPPKRGQSPGQFMYGGQQDKAAREKAAREKAARDKAERDKQDAARKQQQFDADRDRQRADDRRGGPQGAAPKFDRAKNDDEFDRARRRARESGGPDRGKQMERWREDSARKFESVRKQRTERDDPKSGRQLIIEPDQRVIVRQKDRTFIRHDDSRRLTRTGREVRREKRKDGLTMVVTMGLAGALISTLLDDDGRIYRRTSRGRDGRDVVLLDNRRYYGSRGGYGQPYYDSYVRLAPPVVRIPRDQYIVEYDRASPDDLYDALMAPPVEHLDRGYSLDEVRYNYSVLERMRRIDLDTINFDFGAWDVGPDQYPALERMAEAIHRVLRKSPNEMLLIEGHTDAVGSDIDNLSLSDRRAESVAVILTEEFDIPPENLMTQGFGEQHLKVLTEEPSRVNRRVSLRRITPLLSREGWDDPY